MGDYEEDFYTVQTTEGEAISKLIGSRMDAKMQKKKIPRHIQGLDEETVCRNEEENNFGGLGGEVLDVSLSHEEDK